MSEERVENTKIMNICMTKHRKSYKTKSNLRKILLRRIVNKYVNTPDLLKHYKILVNQALTEAKRTKCIRSAEEMRFYAKVLNSSKHTVMRKNTIKHKEIVSENRVEN